jgi:hypothetical protein
MKFRTLWLFGLTVTVVVAQWLSADGLALATPAVPYDPANYAALANPDAPDIPVGTEITAQNWQRYKQYMPLGVQALWAGTFPYHFDASNPDYHMVIGPTIPVRLPSHVIVDTEKYAGQTKLKRLSSGGYGVEGYMAGVPFPDPKEPGLPYKITYNVFYRFYPLIFYSYTMLDAVDSYGNETYSKVTPIYYKLMHLSDDHTPFVNASYANGFLIGAHQEVTEPEQSRYTNIVNLTPDDPIAEPEIYIFLPTLRRSLRLSSAARCAPSLGTDFINDDSEGFLNSPGMFKAELLGEKRILSLQHMDAKTWTDLASFKVKGPVPRWPRPVAGKWELRDAYVIAYTPVPALGRFCYGVRVAFLDKEDWMPLAFDVYDANRNLWKLFLQSTRPLKLDNGEETILSIGDAQVLDLENTHLSFALYGGRPDIKDVPSVARNVEIWAFPGSLTQVMK